LSIIFGPINSRRFGKSLGVDLSPNLKQCNFDCLYCELKGAKVVDEQSSVVPVSEIIGEIKKAKVAHKDIDVLTLTANGEPTLYPYLDELIDKINRIKGDIKTLILTSASTISDKKVQKALAKLDSVKLSLDCATKSCFKKLDRASKAIDLDAIKEGMLEFKKHFGGNLLIEVLFVKGINDNPQEVKEINKFLLQLKPTRVDIGTIDRPPAYDIKPISYDKLYELSLGFDSSINIAIASKQANKKAKFSYSKEEILQTLSLRPLTADDIDILFNEESVKNFKELLASGKIKIVNSAGVEFFSS
jgi:wyosine [tRNA(Phe)-imidazoG37] synthetase (radical SAM superfamily)